MKDKHQVKTRYDQLKQKHKNASDAYIEYALSRDCERFFAHAGYVPKEIANSANTQFRANEYAKTVNSKPKLPKICDDVILKEFNEDSPLKYFRDIRYLDYLGYEPKFSQKLTNGSYEKELLKQAQHMSWRNLCRLLIADGNNAPVIEPGSFTSNLQEIVDRYGILFFSVAGASANGICLTKIRHSLEQLQQVIGCEDYEVGAYQFSFFINTGNKFSSSFFQEDLDSLRIELNDFLRCALIAHEWAHGIDFLIGQSSKKGQFASESRNKNAITDVVDKSKACSLIFNANTRNTLINRSIDNILDTVDYGVRTNASNYPTQLTKLVQDELGFIDLENWDKKSFVNRISSILRPGRHIAKIISAEIELIRIFKNESSNITQSVFYTFAELLEENRFTGKMIFNGYWTKPIELFARAFEGYANYTLHEKNIETVIGLTFTSWNPMPEEIVTYTKEWDVALAEIREKLRATADKYRQASRKADSLLTHNTNDLYETA